MLSINLRRIRSLYKMLITGTPLQNNLKELWSLLNFILPKLFNDKEIFEENENQEQNLKFIKKLHKILSPFLLKRCKNIVDLDIPPKKETHVYVGMTQQQINIYKNLLLKRAPVEYSSKNSLLNILMQLRKACNHPYLFVGAEDPSLPTLGDHLYTSSGKMIVLNKLLDRLKYNHQVLIFS